MPFLIQSMQGALENLGQAKESVIARIRGAYVATFLLVAVVLTASEIILHSSIQSLHSGSNRLLAVADSPGHLEDLNSLLRTADRIGMAGLIANVAVALLLLALAFALFEPILRAFGKRHSAINQALSMNRHFTDLAHLTRNCLVVTNPEGLIEWINPGFTELTGYTLEEARGKKPGTLLQRDDVDKAAVERMRQGLRERGGFSEVLLNYGKNGLPFWIQIDCTAIKADDGTVTGHMAIQSDVTEMRRRESALQSMNVRFRIATNIARVGVWELRTDTHAMWWSDVMYDLIGADRAAASPTLHDLLGRISPEDRAMFELSIDATIENDELLQTRFRIVRAGGDLRSVDVTAAVVADSEYGCRRLIGIAVDVTDRLAQADHERTLQMRLNEVSRQAGKAEVATGVLHNIGNVLNSLGISLSAAKATLRVLKVDKLAEIGGLLPSDAGDLPRFFAEDPRGRQIPEYLSILGEHMRDTTLEIEAKLTGAEGFVGHLYRSVQQQQAHSRVSGLTENVDVREVLDVACAMQAYRKNMADGSVQIIRNFEPVPTVEVQRHKLLDVLGNLVTNAIDAVQSHNGAAKTIHLSTMVKDRGIEIAVSDSGCGISKENLERIWEFGFTTKTTGHGFGLHSCALAVSELGGHMTVRSAGAGQGATFKVWLPAGPSESESVPVAA